MGVAELVLIRHAESTANVARQQADACGAEVIDVDCRDADVPLSELGRAQAGALGSWLATHPFGNGPQSPPLAESVWSSPYVRARQTASATVTASGRDIDVRVDERLRDKELGILDNLTWTGVQARFPAEAERKIRQGRFYYRPPGGESWSDLALRIRSTLTDLDRMEDGRRVVVFTHDAMILLFRYVCEVMDEPGVLALSESTTIANTSVTRLVRSGPDGSWKVALFNGQEHLLTGGQDLRTAYPPAAGGVAPPVAPPVVAATSTHAA